LLALDLRQQLLRAGGCEASHEAGRQGGEAAWEGGGWAASHEAGRGRTGCSGLLGVEMGDSTRPGRPSALSGDPACQGGGGGGGAKIIKTRSWRQ
jgi:hypothetical protein